MKGFCRERPLKRSIRKIISCHRDYRMYSKHPKSLENTSFWFCKNFYIWHVCLKGALRAFTMGTVSRGSGCANFNAPGILSSVASHLSWLKKHASRGHVGCQKRVFNEIFYDQIGFMNQMYLLCSQVVQTQNPLIISSPAICFYCLVSRFLIPTCISPRVPSSDMKVVFL